jgi:hypothetical protein
MGRIVKTGRGADADVVMTVQVGCLAIFDLPAVRSWSSTAPCLRLPRFDGHGDHPPVSRNSSLRVCGCF